MTIILISLCTPTLNNIRAASALPYHLIKGAKEVDEKEEFEIYSYNINNINEQDIKNVEIELNTKIHLLKKSWWMIWMFKLHLGFLRILLRLPYLAYLHLPKHISEEISKGDPDIIWIYGEELAGLARLFPKVRRIVTMPDCESMYYHRLLRKSFGTSSLLKTLKYTYAYYQYRKMEHENCVTADNVTYHFVGKADEDFYKEINPKAKTIFLSHPLYQTCDGAVGLKEKQFHSPIRVVIAGRNDIYQQEAINHLVEALCYKEVAVKLSSAYHITFLGKGWDEPVNSLKDAGWQVDIKTWVDDYAEELQQHDIGLYPISVGTGTKGKVLDAFVNGLLVIGTPFALENIAVNVACFEDYDNETGALCYSTAQEVINILADVMKHRKKYEHIAQIGHRRVLKYHDRKSVAQYLFSPLQK